LKRLVTTVNDVEDQSSNADNISDLESE